MIVSCEAGKRTTLRSLGVVSDHAGQVIALEDR